MVLLTKFYLIFILLFTQFTNMQLSLFLFQQNRYFTLIVSFVAFFREKELLGFNWSWKKQPSQRKIKIRQREARKSQRSMKQLRSRCVLLWRREPHLPQFAPRPWLAPRTVRGQQFCFEMIRSIFGSSVLGWREDLLLATFWAKRKEWLHVKGLIICNDERRKKQNKEREKERRKIVLLGCFVLFTIRFERDIELLGRRTQKLLECQQW